MLETCKTHKMSGCRDKHCLRARGRAHKRELVGLRGRNKALRKELQRLWVPGTVGTTLSRTGVFTVIGWGQSADDRWKVIVSVDGAIAQWDWYTLVVLNPA